MKRQYNPCSPTIVGFYYGFPQDCRKRAARVIRWKNNITRLGLHTSVFFLVCSTTNTLSDENKYLDRVFSKNNYNEDFIQRNTHRHTTTEANDNATPTTTATIPYIKGILRTSRASYNSSISASLTNLLPHYVSYWLTSKTKTNRGTDREQWIRSIAPTATPPTSVRLAETSQLDWLNTNERRGKTMSTITLLNITDLRTTLLTGTLRNA